MTPIPVTVFTGFLGAGKTTIILSLLRRLPSSYNVVLLKNEFGDTKVDSELAAIQQGVGRVGGSGDGDTGDGKGSHLKVQEMLNGCLCCVLVGQMKTALLEIKEKYRPDRIIIETSGSAFPAPIAWQIRQIADEGFTLDGIITVIDCVNFTGYEDTSYTARLQAKYTDLILLNKHELVSEQQMETVLDHVYLLNEDTPKVRCEGTTGISPDLVFGIDTQLFKLGAERGDKDGDLPVNAELIELDANHHANEVDLVQIWVGGDSDTTATTEGNGHEEGHRHLHEHHGHDHDHGKDQSRDLCGVPANYVPPTRESITTTLQSIRKEDIYRIKGFIRIRPSPNNENEPHHVIVNWAFGRFTLTDVPKDNAANGDSDAQGDERRVRLDGVEIRLTVMGVGLVGRLGEIARAFSVPVGMVKFTAAGRRA